MFIQNFPTAVLEWTEFTTHEYFTDLAITLILEYKKI